MQGSHIFAEIARIVVVLGACVVTQVHELTQVAFKVRGVRLLHCESIKVSDQP